MFRKEVQNIFETAGWHEGRNVARQFDKVKGFNKFPEFLKRFLYEYGNLEVYTLYPNAVSLLDFKAVAKGRYNLTDYLNKPRYYGNVFTFPIAYYQMDEATLECDAEGRIYLSGEFPCLLSADFKTGIEKVILENYTGILHWDAEANDWVDES
jgi:hypothetical protein